MDCWSGVAPLAFGDLDLPPNSPASIALHRVQSLGISLSRHGHALDQFGPFCLQTCNFAEVELRLQWAWRNVVAQKVTHRPDFAGLESVDLAATRAFLHTLSQDDQALYRLGLVGGLYTESYKAKWSDQSDACPWCGQTDTLQHRFWECVQHQDLRDSLAPDAFANLDLIPPVMSLRGWAVLPPTWTSWIRLLVDLPASPPPPAIFLRPGCWNEVFTDGSCLHQSCPLFRFAAWSVTVAPPFHASWTPGGASVVCASYLPGVCQTAYRAELYAVGYALHCAAESGAPIRI